MRCSHGLSCTMLCAVCLSLSAPLFAQSSAAKPVAKSVAPSVPSGTLKDLPVRRVVLYKNGVGYFEHAGTVQGNQRVAIDFTSSQLNDVLQSLTVLDEGGGRISGVNYNSTTPLAEQLKALSLGMTDEPTSTELFQALRGQRVEVIGAPGATIAGRLMSIESRSEKVGSGDATVDRFYLTVVANSGAVRVIELTPQLSVRPLDANLQGQMDRYLELLSTTHANGLRHLTLNATGQGARELRVSYISEVPVWKVTYRMVFPHEANGKATVQGWAVVDNTVGADWENVKLSLVAGAPQSFIQPMSQPLYTRRPEIPISTVAQTTPQTHAAAEGSGSHVVHVQSEMMNSQLLAPQSVVQRDKKTMQAGGGRGFGAGMEESVIVEESVHGFTPLGGVDRASDAFQEGDVTTNAFDDFFEYALTQPVTIHKNESAMVPILQQDLPAEHVTLWSARENRPLRAVWLDNQSKLTLDSGSFSIFESGEFAGEGLLDPIHPGERRLLSYAVDQAVRVKGVDNKNASTLHHIEIHNGSVIQTNRDSASVTYSAVNSGDAERVVLIEHPRHDGGWELNEGLKAAESTSVVYRFRLAVPAHSTAKFEVSEHGPATSSVVLNSRFDQRNYLRSLIELIPQSRQNLTPILDAQGVIADLESRIKAAKETENSATTDESRARENLTALKGNDAAKRFVEELNRAEDQLQTTHKEIASLEAQKKTAVEKLNAIIAALDWEWDVR